jgi:DNA-binding IclR family transcriptional regulator
MWLQHRILNHSSLLQVMETLSAKSGNVVLLAMQNGLHAQYTHIVSSRASRVGLKPGLLRPICRAAVGKAILSTKSDEEVRQIARNVNATETTLAKAINSEELLVELRACQRTGFAFSCDSVTQGSAVIATLIPVEVAGAPVAIGVAVHSSEFDSLRPIMMELLRTTLGEYFAGARNVDPRADAMSMPSFHYSIRNKD